MCVPTASASCIWGFFGNVFGVGAHLQARRSQWSSSLTRRDCTRTTSRCTGTSHAPAGSPSLSTSSSSDGWVTAYVYTCTNIGVVLKQAFVEVKCVCCAYKEIVIIAAHTTALD